MTVAELIEELQKYPGHHSVMVEHEVSFSYSDGLETDFASVIELRGECAGTVIIDVIGGR